MNKKTLQSYVDVLRQAGVLADCRIETSESKVIINHLSYNSMDVIPGTLFICKGRAFKKEYLAEAFDKGAVCYIAERPIMEDRPCIIVSNLRKALIAISEFHYDDCWKEKLDIIGVTGTKGKSTTVVFLDAILEDYCNSHDLGPVGMLTGIYNYDGEKKRKAHLTTEEILELNRNLYNCVENGCRYAVMEVSSQALRYGRTGSVDFKTGIFLNIGEDHISESEHRNMEDYFNSKLRLIGKSQTVCINLDMDREYLEKVRKKAFHRCRRVITFGTVPEADCYGFDIKETLDSLSLKVRVGGRTEELHVNIGGAYNVENVLASVAAAVSLDIPFENVKRGLAHVKVPGRMEVFQLPDKDVTVIVDYAHNEMSYNALFESINRDCPERKKLFLFGCVGGRAFNRREEGGRIADREADRVILTEYDYGTESIDDICSEIREYISPEKDVKIITDRQKAVEYALESSRDGWVVVLAGYSSGDCLIRGRKAVPVPCDTETVKKYIAEHN